MSGGALDASVTLDEVLAVVAAKRVPLAPELAGYLVLEIAEQADARGGDVDLKSVFVGEEGTVALVRSRRVAASGDAEASIRVALARLLEASGSHTPSLVAASRRKSGAGLAGLAEELQAALIPVNRAAGRRALARLAREVKRVAPPPPKFSPEDDPTARSRTLDEVTDKTTASNWNEMPTTEFIARDRPPSSPSETDVDALIADFGVTGGGDQQHARALRAMVGLEPTPTAPPSKRPPRESPREERRVATSAGGGPMARDETDVEALLALHDAASPAFSPLSPPTPRDGPPVARSREPHDWMVTAADSRQLPTQPSQLKKTRASLPAPRQGSIAGRLALAVVALAVLGAGGWAIWTLRREALEVRTAMRAAEPAAAVVAPQLARRACFGTLVVADVPPHAEVLLREGQAPLDIARMPVGARLEFVATAEGYAPKRVVVPAGGEWDPGPDGRPRFEAAVQLDATRARGGAADLWPAGEPGSEVGGQGAPGTVHVVATPRGAEIWMLAGIGPEARIEQVRCDQDIDVLVAGPTTYRRRLHVVGSDFAANEAPPAPGSKGPVRIARVSAK